MQIRQHQLSINSLGILVLKHRWKVKYRTKIGKTIKLVFEPRICIRTVILKIFHFETDREDFQKKKEKKKKEKSGSLLKQPFFLRSVHVSQLRIALQHARLLCKYICMNDARTIHCHSHVLQTPGDLQVPFASWPKKTGEIKWKNERGKNRTSWRKGQLETSNKGRLRKEGRE